MTRELDLIVSEADKGLTVGKFLRKNGFSQRLITSLKHRGGITSGGNIARCVDPVTVGEVIHIIIEDGGRTVPAPDIKARTVFENDDLVVFDKPAGLAVHPSIVHYSDTLGNLYAALYPNSAFRPVHRLDKDTSGLIVCAKNALAASLLQSRVSKTYYAAVDGEITESGRIDLPIGRCPDSIIKRTVRDDGQSALTLYEPILYKNGRTLLEITLKTGRTHQIRVHFSHIGFPLCGDELYGGDRSEITRQALHCGKMEIRLPISEKTAVLESPLPLDIGRLFE